MPPPFKSTASPVKEGQPEDGGSLVELQPLIANLLAKKATVPGSVFIVEGVDAELEVTKRYRSVRLLLGDGELCIQALLHPDLHSLVDQEDITLGSYVRTDKFALKLWTLSEQEKMVYLLVEKLKVVGFNSVYLNQEELEPQHEATREPYEVDEKAGLLKEDYGDDDISDGSIDEAFDSIAPPTDPRTLQSLDPAHPSPDAANASRPWTSRDPTAPVKLTALRSIPTLPYAQNWTVNVLAVVASLSDVEPSQLAGAPTQRTARLADPTTSKRVHLTVFLDAELFAPRVGSAVLLLGLKNHRFDGGSLKKYASDRPPNGRPWFFEEPAQLGWCDVAGLKRWWKGKAKLT
jgi:hypothetical protein